MIVVVPGARAITVPSGLTVATVVSSLLHSSHEPTSTLPFLFVTVAARCTVSPIDVAVTAAGARPTHAAPSGPMARCEGPAWPIIPYVRATLSSDTRAAAVETDAAIHFPAIVKRGFRAATGIQGGRPGGPSCHRPEIGQWRVSPILVTLGTAIRQPIR
jgi:hypothetical protein